MKKGFIIVEYCFLLCFLFACSSSVEPNESISLNSPNFKNINSEHPIILEQKQDQDMDSQQQTNPVEPTEELVEPPQATQRESIVQQQSLDEVSPLPFQDFKERWNSISIEQMSNLLINNLDLVMMNKEEYYRARLTEQNELRVHVNRNSIYQLELITGNKSLNTINKMLTSWNQIITVMHPNIEIYDVDSLFQKIGVGPNLDMKNVKATTFSYLNVSYEVIPTEVGYTFKATYEHIQ